MNFIIGLSEEKVKAKIAQFYTDLNIDGRFLCLSENQWGLEFGIRLIKLEEIVNPVKRRKRKKPRKSSKIN